MTIYAIVARIQIATRKPFGERWVAIIEHFFERFIPMDHWWCSNFPPKFFWLLNRPQISICIVGIGSIHKLAYDEIRVIVTKTHVEIEWRILDKKLMRISI